MEHYEVYVMEGAEPPLKEIWAHTQDEDIGESNERHLAFIVALREAFDALGGAVWKKKNQDGQDQKVRKDQEVLKREQVTQGPPTPRFVNQFKDLEVEDIPTEDEAEVEPEQLGKPDLPTAVNDGPKVSKAKSKGKGKKKATNQPLESYKFTSDTEIYYAVCFFIRDFLGLRQYTRDIWRQVGLGKINCTVAGALSNLAVGMVKSLQFELATDYPGCVNYRSIVNHLVRNDSPEIIGSIPTSNGSAKSKQVIPGRRRDGMREVEEELLLTTHDDLASFIKEYRKTRNGKPSSAFKNTNWNPNFTAKKMEFSDVTPQKIRQWRSDYAISFMYDFVNMNALWTLVGETGGKPLEKMDWTPDDPFKTEWMTKTFWGASDFAAEMTKLAMQKQGSPLIEELRPHHVFQLQLAVDSMTVASRWHPKDNSTVPPRNLYGPTSPTLAWDLTASHLHDLQHIADRWTSSTEILLGEFKEERLRLDDPTLWSHPISRLERVKINASVVGSTPFKIGREAAAPGRVNSNRDTFPVGSMFRKSDSNGLWLYSPYLCGVAQVDFLNMSYDWGSKCWDRSQMITSFFQIYNALVENRHMTKSIKFLDQLMKTFEDDIFRPGKGRPTLDGPAWRFSDASLMGAGVKAQFLASMKSNNQRKMRGEEFFFRSRGAPSHHSKFLNSSKLFSLCKSNWISTRVDTSVFPSLAKTPRRHTEFLDAVKKDLTADFDCETPIDALNYHAILGIIMVIYQGMDEAIRDLPMVKRMMKEHGKDAGWHDKMSTLAFHSQLALLQDSQGERLDTPVLRRMGATLEDLWDKMGEEMMPIFVLNAPEEPDKVSEPGKIRYLGDNKNGMASLREKLEPLRFVDPAAYERAINMAQNMPVGGCENCPGCQAGVPIDAVPDKCLVQ